MIFNAPTNVVTVQPSTEPVSTSDVAANAYIVDDTSDYVYLAEQIIPAARQMVERLACRSLITQTRKQIYDCMPSWFSLRYGPVQSVTAITYVDSNEATQTLASALYDVDTSRVPGRIMMGYGDNWPLSLHKTNAVNVTYVTGYGATAASVPIIYRRAIIVLCTHWYNNRDQFGCDTDDIANRVIEMIALEGRTLEYA